jgi:hypothetical protein
MKTKTLLIAAAALAATVISSEAQTVFSANIVGYANVVMPAGVFSAVANPFDKDGIDNITNVLVGIPNSSQVFLFNNGFGAPGFSPATSRTGAWSADAATSFIPPGVGFMIKPGSNYTNTFVGTVIPAVGGTNSLTFIAGQTYLVGSVTPYGGTLSNAVDQGVGTLNLGSSLPNSSVIQTFNNGFLSVSKSRSGVWGANPTIGVGQAFIVTSGPGGATWQQTLPTSP